jgi:hypothetical protein
VIKSAYQIKQRKPFNQPRQSRRNGSTHQSGQVLAEAVVMLFLMAVLLVALHQVGKQFYQWFKLSDRVYQVAHKKSVFTAQEIEFGMHLKSGTRDFTRTLLQTQWALGQRDWVSVLTSQPFKHHAVFLSGVGATAIHQETAKRIKNNLMAWRAQTMLSQAKVWLVKPGLTAIDLPWRRAQVETDWLTQWSDTAPIRQNNDVSASHIKTNSNSFSNLRKLLFQSLMTTHPFSSLF